MKNLFKNVCSLLFLAFFMMACEEDNMMPEGQWDLSEAILILPQENQEFILDQDTPEETITFSWDRAISSANYAVTYSLVIDTLGSTDFSHPILEIPANNNGRALNASLAYQTLDNALAISGYPANQIANLTWAVKAQSLTKSSFASQVISIKRFENDAIPVRLFLSGTAAENNNILAQAIPFRRLNNESGSPSNVFELYTSLTAGNTFKFFSERSLPAFQYGGSDGVLVNSGAAFTVFESGTYRIQVDLENRTYQLLRINNWSIVGSPIAGGWGGDVPLDYQGGGIWKSSVDLIALGGFAFRANGNWDYLLKRIVGTQNNLVLESQAASQGVAVEDIPSNVIGRYFVTLNLSANAYNFSFEIDNSVVEPLNTPNELYLIANGAVVQQFSRNGNVFSSANFIPLQSGVNYILNSQANGNGTSYSISSGIVGQSANPDGDRVFDAQTLQISNAPFSVNNDRSFRFRIDFQQAALNWEYYNFKLFHWNNWETRNEFPMAYQHPNTYTITTNINANYEMKFISPWDFDMGSNSPSSLSGSISNGSGSNLTCVTTNGSYTITITLSDDFQSGTYVFE